MIEFKKWPKIPRWENENYTITEKIDGTNACVVIDEDGNIGAQSRNKIITPQQDNHGFAQWVEDNREELLTLGPGHHFGEWWGQGINRGYGQTERYFSLFDWWKEEIPSCCNRIYVFPKEMSVETAIQILQQEGSQIVPGWERPEGLVIISKHYRAYYKVILDK